ncbi:MAG: hypothetical protein EKK63_04950 [Acinetobacter sp.]|uniref:hypothetical protein n=1 Tax=Acinetobacter sp. TaxID=472 RepID=UPI000FAB8F62|nr:hypothetical protein [Acinetobacter sp.]RUP41605.1 MAG: hypothetical protein EKK63_04950 [Acinetobacter sp.]
MKKSVLKGYKKQVDPLEKAKNDLKKREEAQVFYTEVNKIVRKYKANHAEGAKILSEKYNISIDKALTIFKPDFAGRIGFPAYVMQNNNGNIKRLRERVATLEKMATKADNIGSQKYQAGDVVVEYNYTDARIRLFYPSKPDSETISKLKKNAFKWSPFNQAWQRQLTGNAEYATENILGVKYLQNPIKQS